MSTGKTSRRKGAVGEREVRDILRRFGFRAERGQPPFGALRDEDRLSGALLHATVLRAAKEGQRMSLLDEARNAPTRVFRHHGRGIGRGVTSESHRVEISTEARDALVELADAARAFVATTSYYRQSKDSRPEFEEFALALERLQR